MCMLGGECGGQDVCSVGWACWGTGLACEQKSPVTSLKWWHQELSPSSIAPHCCDFGPIENSGNDLTNVLLPPAVEQTAGFAVVSFYKFHSFKEGLWTLFTSSSQVQTSLDTMGLGEGAFCGGSLLWSPGRGGEQRRWGHAEAYFGDEHSGRSRPRPLCSAGWRSWPCAHRHRNPGCGPAHWGLWHVSWNVCPPIPPAMVMPDAPLPTPRQPLSLCAHLCPSGRALSPAQDPPVPWGHAGTQGWDSHGHSCHTYLCGPWGELGVQSG